MLKLQLQYFGHLVRRADSLLKTLMLGKIEGKRRRGATGNEISGWHHRLHRHWYKQTLGDSEEQGSLVCCSSWCPKELDTTELLNSNSIIGKKRVAQTEPDPAPVLL